MELALFTSRYAALAFRLPEQTNGKVQNYCEYNADYDARYYGKEELKAPLLQKYVAGEFSQERNSMPKDQQQTEDGKKGPPEDKNSAYTLKIHAKPPCTNSSLLRSLCVFWFV